MLKSFLKMIPLPLVKNNFSKPVTPNSLATSNLFQIIQIQT
jgi:hypothetical protein